MYKIRGFNGIRGIAAVFVVLTHLGALVWLDNLGVFPDGFVNSFHGSVGVQAFFVLSGFLITYLLITEHESNGKVSLYNFYVRRSLRIFPLYFLVLFLVTLMHIFGDYVTNWQSITFASLYSYNFIPKVWYSKVLGHTWSLAVEEHFYLIWPWIFVAFATKYKKLLIVLVVLIIVSLCSKILLYQWDWIYKNFFVDRWSFIAGANIAYGCFAALLIFKHAHKEIIKKYLSMNIVLALGVVMWFCQIWMPDSVNILVTYVRGGGLTLLICWIFLNQKSLLTKCLEIKPLNYLGEISYGIYMYQGFFLSTGPFRKEGQTWPPDQQLGLIMLLFAVPISYHYFEKPITKLKSKFQRIKKPVTKTPDFPILGRERKGQ